MKTTTKKIIKCKHPMPSDVANAINSVKCRIIKQALAKIYGYPNVQVLMIKNIAATCIVHVPRPEACSLLFAQSFFTNICVCEQCERADEAYKARVTAIAQEALEQEGFKLNFRLSVITIFN